MECFPIPYDCQSFTEFCPLLPHHGTIFVWVVLSYNLPLSMCLYHVPSWPCTRSWISYDPYKYLLHSFDSLKRQFKILNIAFCFSTDPSFRVSFLSAHLNMVLIVMYFNLVLIPSKISCRYNVCLASIQQMAITFERKHVNSMNFILVFKADHFLLARGLLFSTPSTIVDIIHPTQTVTWSE